MLHTQLVGLVYAPDLLGHPGGQDLNQAALIRACALNAKPRGEGYESVYQVESQAQEEYNQESAENKNNSPSSSNRICSFFTGQPKFQHVYYNHY